jgi:hypothetical protein
LVRHKKSNTQWKLTLLLWWWSCLCPLQWRQRNRRWWGWHKQTVDSRLSFWDLYFHEWNKMYAKLNLYQKLIPFPVLSILGETRKSSAFRYKWLLSANANCHTHGWHFCFWWCSSSVFEQSNPRQKLKKET